ncbi:DNA polymerase subunit cdc27 domain-containing protein [Ditylenchus destructor]|nr:DNA polymerase subunit cdc27 domain-containing protein [Ditylenchus destructor]
MSQKKPTQSADPMSEPRKKLEKWILDEERIVTSSYLLRNTELNVVEVEELMQSFLSDNLAKNVSATYFIIGQIRDPEAEDDGVAGVYKSLVCNQQNLEKTKAMFETISTCSLYSLQAKPVEDYAILYNVKHEIEGYPYVMPSKDKLLFWQKRTDKIHTRWEESRGDVAKLKDIKIKKMMQDEMMENAQKKNVQKVTIDNEESDEEPMESGENQTKETAEGMAVDEGTSAQGSMFGSNMKGIFSTGIDSSPEKDVQQSSKAKKSPPAKKRKSQGKTSGKSKHSARRVIDSDDEDEEADVEDRDKILEEQDEQIEQEPIAPPQSQTTTSYRKEMVSESFVDDDGYTVTRMVPKLVEMQIESVPQNRPAAQGKPVLKPSNAANAKKPAKAAKSNPNQPKISNFFTKK